MPDTPRNAQDPRNSIRNADEATRRGTRILPEPDKSPTVAGMPRDGRALSDPGDPGIPRPENDVYANEASDLSESETKDESK
ncbi:hypothetical protein CAL12_09415 [Bordetella genomosp. 8]|uniref:Uncharacterized protein n=1 Tax=Bordetella genomosp. 8 TaxID=1416806 RepID=A0A1W6YJ30_9BORD|nr:hypothetical protein [Bordetella genomosp. 8]ARP81041.1 hypothetical protein CAL12_09415 [Bordetella genomosp. 8]